jgi:hypothetical protein
VPSEVIKPVGAKSRNHLLDCPLRTKRLGLNFKGEFACLLGFVDHVKVIDSRTGCNIETDILHVHASLLLCYFLEVAGKYETSKIQDGGILV